MQAQPARTPALNRYIFALMARPVVLIALGLLFLVWLMQSLRFLDLIINKGLSLSTFLHLTLLLVPFLLTIILPLALLMGSLYTFKQMNDDNEIPALFSLGLTRAHIVRPAFWLAVVVMLLAYLNAFYLTPLGMRTFKALQHEIRSSEGHLLLEEGTFNPLGDDIMVYLDKRIGKTALGMVLVQDARNPDRPVTWMAQSGKITFTPEGRPRLTLTKGIRQEVTPETTSMLSFDEHTLDIQRQIAQPKARVMNAEERFLTELSPTAAKNEKQRRQYKAETFKRLTWPLTPLVLVLLAGVFLVRPRATRRGVLPPTLWAAGLGITYLIMLITLTNMAEDTPLLIEGQLALPLLTLLTLLFLLRERTA